MATETFTLTPKKLFAGSWPYVVTKPGTLLSGQILEAGTPLAADSAGKLFAHPGNTSGFIAATSAGSPTVALDTTIAVAGILMNAANASTGTVNNAGNTVVAGVAADLAVTVYKAGDFFADQLVYKLNGNGAAAGADMANMSTNILKQKLFDNSKIVLTFQDTGEV
jgi:hypothetical protein